VDPDHADRYVRRRAVASLPTRVHLIQLCPLVLGSASTFQRGGVLERPAGNQYRVVPPKPGYGSLLHPVTSRSRSHTSSGCSLTGCSIPCRMGEVRRAVHSDVNTRSSRTRLSFGDTGRSRSSSAVSVSRRARPQGDHSGDSRGRLHSEPVVRWNEPWAYAHSFTRSAIAGRPYRPLLLRPSSALGPAVAFPLDRASPSLATGRRARLEHQLGTPTTTSGGRVTTIHADGSRRRRRSTRGWRLQRYSDAGFFTWSGEYPPYRSTARDGRLATRASFSVKSGRSISSRGRRQGASEVVVLGSRLLDLLPREVVPPASTISCSGPLDRGAQHTAGDRDSPGSSRTAFFPIELHQRARAGGAVVRQSSRHPAIHVILPPALASRAAQLAHHREAAWASDRCGRALPHDGAQSARSASDPASQRSHASTISVSARPAGAPPPPCTPLAPRAPAVSAHMTPFRMRSSGPRTVASRRLVMVL